MRPIKTTVGEQKKRVAVVVGRMQPPTIGHYSVINQVKKFIASNPSLKLDTIPILVVIAGLKTGQDKSRNPLTADERISFMKGSGRADGVRFLKARSAFDAFEEVRKAGYEPIAIAAGVDRGRNYLAMLDKYYKAQDDSVIKHHLIELPRTGADNPAALSDILKHMDKDIPITMVSASLARLAVKQGDLEKFAIIVGLSAKIRLANIMFNKIRTAMETSNA